MKVLEEIEGLVSSKLNVIKSTFAMFKLEAKLAGLSVFPLILNICILFVVLLTLWLSVMISAGYLVLLLCNNFLLSISAVLLLNIGLLVGTLKYLSFNLKNMSFVKTREYFSKPESPDYDKLEKTSDGSNSAIGPNTSVPTKQTDRA